MKYTAFKSSEFPKSLGRGTPFRGEHKARWVLVPCAKYESVKKSLPTHKVEETIYPGIFLVVRMNTSKDNIKKQREKFIDLCGRKEKVIADLKNQIEQKKSIIRKSSQNITTSVEAVNNLRNQIHVINVSNRSSEIVGKEFDIIRNHPDVIDVSVENRILVVKTKMIQIVFGSVTYNIGRFEIKVDIDTGDVHMFNKTHVIHSYGESYHHPHIYDGGEPCFGNIRNVVPELIGERKFPALISVCIQYLKSYTIDGGGMPYYDIENWPISRTGGTRAKGRRVRR
jgi:hypothetical protein